MEESRNKNPIIILRLIFDRAPIWPADHVRFVGRLPNRIELDSDDFYPFGPPSDVPGHRWTLRKHGGNLLRDPQGAGNPAWVNDELSPYEVQQRTLCQRRDHGGLQEAHVDDQTSGEIASRTWTTKGQTDKRTERWEREKKRIFFFSLFKVRRIRISGFLWK